MRQFSMPSGWQNGISSWVRFAPMTPATMAVSNTGPLAERSAAVAQRRGNRGGKLHARLRGGACACVAALSLTSTMVGRCSASRCEKLMIQPPM